MRKKAESITNTLSISECLYANFKKYIRGIVSNESQGRKVATFPNPASLNKLIHKFDKREKATVSAPTNITRNTKEKVFACFSVLGSKPNWMIDCKNSESAITKIQVCKAIRILKRPSSAGSIRRICKITTNPYRTYNPLSNSDQTTLSMLSLSFNKLAYKNANLIYAND